MFARDKYDNERSSGGNLPSGAAPKNKSFVRVASRGSIVDAIVTSSIVVGGVKACFGVRQVTVLVGIVVEEGEKFSCTVIET